MSTPARVQDISSQETKAEDIHNYRGILDSQEKISQLPTMTDIQKSSNARKPHFREPTPAKSRKKQYVRMRKVRKVVDRVDNPNGKLPSGMIQDYEEKLPPEKRIPRARTSAELRALPDGTVVEWPRNVRILKELPSNRSIKFEVVEVKNACGCGKNCTSGDCRNDKESVVCRTATCSQASTTCGRRMTEVRDIELRVVNSQICLFTDRRIRRNVVVCPYLGKFCLVDPVKRYTVQLKTKDSKNRLVFLAADAVGGNGRFINHLCDANCRIEELNGEFGPEIAIVANRDIQPGEEVTVDYGPDKRFYCYCGSDKCRDKGRHDPLIPDVVTSRLRSGN